MDRITSFLQSLNDQELAFLYRYKYPSYFDDTRQLVDKEVRNRGLSVPQLEELAAKKISNNNGSCTRCGSVKHFDIAQEKWNTNKYEGLDGVLGRLEMTERLECAVCGYLIYDGNEPRLRWPVWKRVLNALLDWIGR